MLPLAVEGAGMHQANRRWGLPGVGVLAHILFIELLILVISQMDFCESASGSPFGLERVGAFGAIILAVTS